MMEQENRVSKKSLMWSLGLGVLGIIVLGGAYAFGTSDQGQIDVSATIANSNQTRVERGEAPVEQPAARVFQNMPNGGLVPSGAPETPPQPVARESASSTSSTTPEADQDGSSENEDASETETPASEENAVDTSESEAPAPTKTVSE